MSKPKNVPEESLKALVEHALQSIQEIRATADKLKGHSPMSDATIEQFVEDYNHHVKKLVREHLQDLHNPPDVLK